MDRDLLRRYLKHPRILELKLVTLHTVFSNEYGVEKASELFKSFSDISRTNWTVISSVINRKDSVTSMKSRDKTRYRQEVVFMGMCFGENRIEIGKRYLGLSRRMMYEYTEKKIDPNVFVTVEWLDGLDYSVVVAGLDAYKLEIERFLYFVLGLSKVIGHVPMAEV